MCCFKGFFTGKNVPTARMLGPTPVFHLFHVLLSISFEDVGAKFCIKTLITESGNLKSEIKDNKQLVNFSWHTF